MERSKDSQNFETIWRTCREEGEFIPKRSSINPRLFKAYLSNILICELSPDDHKCEIQLIGEDAKEIMGFKSLGIRTKGFDINSLFPQSKEEEWIERQRAYHDFPAGKVDLFQFVHQNDLINYLEITYFPVWGQNEERQLLILGRRPPIPQNAVLHASAVRELKMLEEQSIDIGAGLPVFSLSG